MVTMVKFVAQLGGLVSPAKTRFLLGIVDEVLGLLRSAGVS